MSQTKAADADAPGLDATAVEAAVWAEDGHRVRELLAAAAEADRREWWQLSRTPAFAAFAVGVAGGQKKADAALAECHGHHYHVSDVEWAAIAGVLADRNPPWLAALVDARLDHGWLQGGFSWPLARWLVRAGAIGRPVTPAYGVAMVQALTQDPPLSPPLKPGASRYERAGYDGAPAHDGRDRGDQLAQVLLADPGLLEHEVWRLFTDPGVGWELVSRNQVTSWDQLVIGDQWSDALASLAADGHLDRGHLLDESLDAFHRDFPPNHVAWYATLHDRPGPLPAEVAALAAGKGTAKLTEAARRLTRMG